MSSKACAECRLGGAEESVADGFFTGYIMAGDRKHPFRGYLCSDHADMLVEDGAKLTERRKA
jgi:hypothetical protein